MLVRRVRPDGGIDYIVSSPPMDDVPPQQPEADIFPEDATVLLTRGGVTEVIRPDSQPKE